jgi:3-hydroxyacyl-[acyl-carrier-protein] dehydratase
MRFTLVDRINAWESGKSLQASKFLALGEEYLADHFPTFPVMPGVLMLEAIVESSAWLWRITSGFQHSVIALREAKNVKYGTFMEPGKRLDLSVELVKIEGERATFKGKGITEEGAQTVGAQIVLAAYNVRTGTVDEKLIAHWKERWAWLTRNKQ